MEEKHHETKEYFTFGLNYILLGIVILILVFSIFQSFQISSVKNKLVSGGAVSDSGGETYEEMMARMHPESAGQLVKSNSPTMVGGC